MADIDKFSEGLVDLAERFADVTDAAQGRGSRQGGKLRARWVLIPAAGAGLYALGASGSLMRQAKSVVRQAKERAADLPDDLMTRVRQAASVSGGGQSSGTRMQSSSGGTRRSDSRSKRSTAQRRSQRRRTAQASSAR
jgi:hypothetical protein